MNRKLDPQSALSQPQSGVLRPGSQTRSPSELFPKCGQGFSPLSSVVMASTSPTELLKVPLATDCVRCVAQSAGDFSPALVLICVCTERLPACICSTCTRSCEMPRCPEMSAAMACPVAAVSMPSIAAFSDSVSVAEPSAGTGQSPPSYPHASDAQSGSQLPSLIIPPTMNGGRTSPAARPTLAHQGLVLGG